MSAHDAHLPGVPRRRPSKILEAQQSHDTRCCLYVLRRCCDEAQSCALLLGRCELKSGPPRHHRAVPVAYRPMRAYRERLRKLLSPPGSSPGPSMIWNVCLVGPGLAKRTIEVFEIKWSKWLYVLAWAASESMCSIPDCFGRQENTMSGPSMISRR